MMARGYTGGGGGAGLPLIKLITSPTSSDFYQAVSGVGDGADNFIAAGLFRHPGPLQPAGFKDIFRNDLGATGWSVFWNFGTVSFEIRDGAGATIGGNTTSFYNSNGYEAGRDVLFLLQCYQTGGAVLEARFWEWDRVVDTQTALNAGMTVSTGQLKLAGAGEGEGLEGFGYYEGTRTDAQIQAYLDAARRGGAMVGGDADSIPWDNRWSAADGDPAATWAGSDGADALTRNGTPVQVGRLFRAA